VIRKIKQVLFSDLARVSSTTFLSTLVKFISNFIAAKVIAVYIGPPGMAFLGQFTNASAIFIMLSCGAINMGVTKFLAEHANEFDLQKRYINNAIKITLITSIGTSGALFLFNHQIGFYLFQTDGYSNLIKVLAICIPFISFNNLLLSIINGFKEYKKFVSISIFSSLIMLALTVVFVKLFLIKGAFLSFILSQSLVVIFSVCYVRNANWFSPGFLKEKFDRHIIKKLSGFSMMAVVSISLLPLSMIVIRKLVISHLSVNHAGIWEGINRISMTYLTLITSSLQVYYLPRLSELQSKPDIRNEIIGAYKFVLPVLLIISGLIFFSRDIIIPILFTSEFAPMRELFAYQLIGDVLKISGYLLAFLMWAKGMVKFFIFSEILFSALYVLLAYIGLTTYNLQGVVLAYMATYFLYLIFFAVYFKNYLLPVQAVNKSERTEFNN
jgi:PST family polysaccharide transporter